MPGGGRDTTMDDSDVFSRLADLAAEVRAMRDDLDRVAEVLWAAAALLREIDAARPRAQQRLIPARRSNRVWAELKIRSEIRLRFSEHEEDRSMSDRSARARG